MDLIIDILKASDKEYTRKINESKYIQSHVQIEESYSTINELFLSLYDPNFSLLPSKEKSLYKKQKLLQIATEIDEKSREKYDKFNYNSKFKKNTIQRGLQLTDHLSTIMYLNDLYGIKTILVFKDKNCYFETTPKDKESVYFVYDESSCKWSLGSENDVEGSDKKSISELDFVIVCDINTESIYKNYLKPISNYKVSDLQEIAKNHSLSLEKDGKRKTKKALYDDINLYHLNLI